MKRKYAFSLAEILIALTVLGVIAVIVVPNIIKNSQRRALRVELQKTYADLEHVSRMFYLTHDMSIRDYAKSVSNGSGYGYDYVKTFSEIIDGQYIKFQSKRNQTGSNASRFQNDYKDLNGGVPNKNYYDDGYIKDGKGRDWYMEITDHTAAVDINGFEKGPNKLGVDVFGFTFQTNGEVTPKKDTYFCGKTGRYSENGRGCTWYALQNVNPTDSKKNYWTDFLNSL